MPAFSRAAARQTRRGWSMFAASPTRISGASTPRAPAPPPRLRPPSPSPRRKRTSIRSSLPMAAGSPSPARVRERGRSGCRISMAPMPSNSRLSGRRREQVSRTGLPMAADCLCVRCGGPVRHFHRPLRRRQAAEHHVAPGVRARPELFARRQVDLLQLSAERAVSGVEGPGCRAESRCR